MVLRVGVGCMLGGERFKQQQNRICAATIEAARFVQTRQLETLDCLNQLELYQNRQDR